jgi:hypothetical protein
MPTARSLLMALSLLVSVLIISGEYSICRGQAGYGYYEMSVDAKRIMAKDLIKLLPRAMGSFIYHNREDFMRGMTFMHRSYRVTPRKIRDIEEVRNQAFARLRRDIPYCVQAFKGGEIKLDTTSGNLAGRLGMIAHSIVLQNYPAFPDAEYLERFQSAFNGLLVENVLAIWLYYDGYGDFNSLGELMERLKEEYMPTFRHVQNDQYPVRMREDPFAMFRAPDKFNKNIVMTNVDFNHVYNNMINDMADAFVFIWKASGMDLAHPSYAAPPGTVISRDTSRHTVHGGALSRHVVRAVEDEEEAAAEGEETSEEGASEESSPGTAE